MPANTTIEIPADSWVMLTSSDIVRITFQNVSDNFLFIKGTADTTAPTTTSGAIRYNPGQGEVNVFLSDLFPGIASCDRIWAYCDEPARVLVSHA